jgi:hypothetical protein
MNPKLPIYLVDLDLDELDEHLKTLSPDIQKEFYVSQHNQNTENCYRVPDNHMHINRF